ncbi:MAG: hypothetical protein ABH831_02090 [Candidatus Nealsonbacteria bacterium]
MISIIKRFVNDNWNDIILVLIVVLISLLSFAAGFIFSKWSEKGEIRLEMVNEIKISSLSVF